MFGVNILEFYTLTQPMVCIHQYDVNHDIHSLKHKW